MNKIIGFDLTPVSHNKVVFFFCLLISLCYLSSLNAQTPPGDTLKNVSADSLAVSDEDETIEEQITYVAEDSVVALPDEGKVFLYGKAKVNYGTMNMESEYIDIDYGKNVVTAYGKKDSTNRGKGNPVFKDGAETIEAEKIMYNLKTRRGKIFNALTKQGELLVVGKEIKKDSTNIIYMKNMKCIPCQEEDARTVFRATKAKIIPDDKIVTGPMFLEVGGVPTPLGLPFGFFPNTKKQHNGVLIPTFGNSPEFGLNLKQGGFYWGINDMMDMAIRGDIYANGSWAINTTNNYFVRYKSSGGVNLMYSRFNIGDRDIPAQFSVQKSYRIGWNHTQDNRNNPTQRFSANVNYVKNQNFNRLNSINTGQFLTNTFQSNINYTKTFKLSSLSLNALHNQNAINNNVEIIFPSATFNVNRFFPFKRAAATKQNAFDKLGISYVAESKSVLSGKDSLLFQGNIIDSIKYGIKHNIPISTSFNFLKFITVSPALNLSSSMSTKSIRKEFYRDTLERKTKDGIMVRDSLAVGIRNKIINELAVAYEASFSTNINTNIYFDYLFKRGRTKQIRHLIIPTLGYTYRPDYGKSQYGFWKKVQSDTLGNISNYSVFEKSIYQGPGIGEINGLSLNLSNNLEGKFKVKTDSGVTFKKITLIQNAGISTFYNFAADSFKMTDISFTARTVLFKNINLNLSSNFDPYVYSNSLNRRINRLYYEYDGRLARFKSAGIAVSTALSSNMVEAAKRLRKPPSMTNAAENGAEAEEDTEEKLPWNININYNLTLTDLNNTRVHPTHNLGITADFKPTKFWKIGLTTGFDFNTQKMSTTNLSIYRDLKCWEARISWVPFGIRKSYVVGINLKTSLLSDFKPERRRNWFDNFQ